MKASQSIKKNHEFRRIYAKGASAASASIVLYCRKNRQGQSRLGLTVSTKVGGAVVRNRVRRRLREIYRLNAGRLKEGYDVIAVARVKAAHSRYAVLERDFLRLSQKLDLLKPEG